MLNRFYCNDAVFISLFPSGYPCRVIVAKGLEGYPRDLYPRNRYLVLLENFQPFQLVWWHSSYHYCLTSTGSLVQLEFGLLSMWRNLEFSNYPLTPKNIAR